MMDQRKVSSRKEQRIKQLLSVKEQILSELAQLEEVDHVQRRNENGRDKGKKPHSRQLPALSQTQATGKSLAQSSLLSESAPSMMNLPLTLKNGKKKGGIKLPIFRLPPPDPNLLALQQQLENTASGFSATDPTTLSPSKSPNKLALPSSTSIITSKQFIPCKDSKLVPKTFLLLLQQLNPNEKQIITSSLFLGHGEIDQLVLKLKDPKLNNNRFLPSTQAATNPLPGAELLTNLLSPHDQLTLFLTARYYVQQEQQGQWLGNTRNNAGFLSLSNSESFDGDGGILPGIEALRVASSEFDFNSIGVSHKFKNFLLLQDESLASMSFSRQSAYPVTRGGLGLSTAGSMTGSSVSNNNHGFERMNSFNGIGPLMKSFSLPAIDKQELGDHHPSKKTATTTITNDTAIPGGKFDFYASQLSSANNSFMLPPTAQRTTRTGMNTRGKSRQGTALPPPTALHSQSLTAKTGTAMGNRPGLPSRSHIATTQSLDQFPSLASSSNDPNQLSSELLKSLLNVQKHTSLVKKSLESAQSFVTLGEYNNTLQQQQTLPPSSSSHRVASTSSSTYRLPKPIATTANKSKAKEVIHMLASQKLAKALSSLITKEMKRGFLSWKLAIIQYYRSRQMSSFIKVIAFRNVLIAFQRIIWRILSKALSRWKHQVQEINLLLQRKRLLSAIITIQSFFRQMLAKERVRIKRHRKKYELLYEATIKIQAILRGKRLRWKFLKYQRDKKERIAATLIQKIYRGYAAKKRVYLLKLRKNRSLAVTLIQKIIRGKLTRNIFKRLIYERRRKLAAIKVQKMIRGYITRKNIATLLINRARHQYVVQIQKIMRGYLIRKNITKKIQELQEYKQRRLQAVIKMQSTYRMYRANIVYRILSLQHKIEMNKHNIAATQINRIIRGFLARQLRKQLLQERLELWISQAREWTEVWSDETESYFYYNNFSGESIWEPLSQGYVRHDGRLVLQSGEIIDDPDAVGGGEEGYDPIMGANNGMGGNGGTGKGPAEKKKTKRQLAKLCNECQERTAIRLCNECGDQFCTKCYKQTHLLGARRHHTYKAIGPKDCNECEDVLAIRFCITCDENFCDTCWRRLHSHGKRIFHPYSEINPEGRVDKRVFTMDGDQLDHGYDAAYAQQRMDATQMQQMSALLSEQELQQQHQFWEENDSQGYQDTSQFGETGGDYYDPNYAMTGTATEGYDGTGAYYDEAGNVINNGAAGGGGEEWAQYYDENGYLYYYNNYTGQSQYENPYESQ